MGLLTSLGINYNNGRIDVFTPTEYLKEARELTALYKKISLSKDLLDEILSSEETRVMWNTTNRKWRCAVIFSIEDDDKVAIFLPWINSDESVVAGTRGLVELYDVIGAYQEVISAFKMHYPH
jgi:hypothetical protein